MKTTKIKLQELEHGQTFTFKNSEVVYKFINSDKTFKSDGSFNRTYFNVENIQTGALECFTNFKQYMWVMPQEV